MNHARWARAARGLRRILSLWHVPCILMTLSGCLALHGPWYLITNSPPEQVTVSPVGLIRMDEERKPVIVEFFDVDGDDLSFRWFVDGELATDALETRYVDQRGRPIQGSVLRLVRDEVDNAASVDCVISDGDPDLPPVSISWIVSKEDTT